MMISDILCYEPQSQLNNEINNASDSVHPDINTVTNVSSQINSWETALEKIDFSEGTTSTPIPDRKREHFVGGNALQTNATVAFEMIKDSIRYSPHGLNTPFNIRSCADEHVHRMISLNYHNKVKPTARDKEQMSEIKETKEKDKRQISRRFYDVLTVLDAFEIIRRIQVCQKQNCPHFLFRVEGKAFCATTETNTCSEKLQAGQGYFCAQGKPKFMKAC